MRRPCGLPVQEIAMHASPSRSPESRFRTTTLVAVIAGLAAAAALTAFIVERPTLPRHAIGTAQAATLETAPGDPSVPKAESVFERSPAGVEEPPTTF
jgi:hypothetical protein